MQNLSGYQILILFGDVKPVAGIINTKYDAFLFCFYVSQKLINTSPTHCAPRYNKTEPIVPGCSNDQICKKMGGTTLDIASNHWTACTEPQKMFNVPRIQNCQGRCSSNISTALSRIKLSWKGSNKKENPIIASWRLMLNEKWYFD